MPLYSTRQKRRDKADRAAQGSPPALTTEFSPEARMQLWYAMQDNSPARVLAGHLATFDGVVLAEMQRDVLVREWGLPDLPQGRGLYGFLLYADDEQMVDIVESWIQVVWVTTLQVTPVFEDAVNAADVVHRMFRRTANTILDDHDIAYQIVGREMVPRASMAMWAGVVEPMLSLTDGGPELESVERKYREALGELKSGGDPSDAITDAGTALQTMLTILGCDGNALAPLLASAKAKGLLGPHDSKLWHGVKAIGDWVSADRSTRGDAHQPSTATRDDAWLAVHVAGALILRLAKRLP